MNSNTGDKNKDEESDSDDDTSDAIESTIQKPTTTFSTRMFLTQRK